MASSQFAGNSAVLLYWLNPHDQLKLSVLFILLYNFCKNSSSASQHFANQGHQVKLIHYGNFTLCDHLV